MSAKKTQATRKAGHSAVGTVDDPRVSPERGAAAPSRFQKCLLAVAIAVEASWVAALVAMALAE